MAFTRRTSSRACKELTMARIVACLDSPQEAEINLKDSRVLSSRFDSCLRSRRATCTGTLKSPVKKMSELCLSSPQRTPKSLLNTSCLIRSKSLYGLMELYIYIYIYIYIYVRTRHS
ncbi:unnamed protein product [Schistosoma curassoni]|uniref:Uncharacterized protein n=1 Tax=Schistosoma curassoni TaxID=6186 RepID=A0A183JL00_9TREM|nr:unnamed protein product [Schistosoma curassoni]